MAAEIGNIIWYVSLVLAIGVTVVAIFYLFAMLRILFKTRESNSETREHQIASPRTLRYLLKFTGTYFFSFEGGRIRVTNADIAEAAAISAKLHARKDVMDFICSSSASNAATSSMDLRIDLDGNGQHWYEMRLSVFRYSLNKVRVYGILIPTDNIKQQEHDMLEMHRRSLNAEEKDNFIREMNHSVRTPLNAILGFSELLADPEYEMDQEEAAQCRAAIESSASSLTKILENVLTISHMNSENIHMDDHPLSVPELMRSVISDNAELLEASGISVVEVPSPEPCTIVADVRIMKRVIDILVDNVVRHASSGKMLAYGWTVADNGDVRIFVKDKGPGIPEAHLPFIFKPFYKVDAFSEGTGQSLTIAKGYVEHEKAEISCESGQDGTSFLIDFKKALPVLAIPLPFFGCGLLVASLLFLHFSLKYYRTLKYNRRLQTMEEEAIARNLELSGGHLFKLKDNTMITTQETADYFSFTSSKIPISIYMDSLDDADRSVAEAVAAVESGEIVRDLVSLPNFRTFKIMSFSIIATRLADDDGEMVPMGVFFSVDDAQARMDQMREVFAKEEESIAKQSFIASMGHEIRNPLNAIVGFSSLLADRYFEISAEERNSYAEIIRQNNDHLLSLLEGALLSAKEQDVLLKSSFKLINVAELMQELFKTNSVIVPPYLSFDFKPGSDAFINVSRTSMRQIVSNLINNSCKFTRGGGIVLGWSCTEENVEVFVEDTGIGISEDDIDKIFNKYYKTDSSTSGAGIGLPMCKRLAGIMGGELAVDSVPGIGSRFSVVIPRVYPESNP